MDFELERRKKIFTALEALVIVGFLVFTTYQIYLYVSAKRAAAAKEKAAWDEMLSHPVIDSVSDGKADILPVAIEYEGDHPYSSVDLPYTLASLSIENSEGKAVYTNGKEAGINLPVEGIPGSGTDALSAVDLRELPASDISLSGTGANPTLSIKFTEGYSAKVSLGHAVQASFNKDGDVTIYNLQEGDDFDITYSFNYDSYKYPGASRFVFTGNADGDGVLELKLRGNILTITGVKFYDAMLSVEENTGSRSYGMPLDGSSGFITYDFKTKSPSNVKTKKIGGE